MDNSSTHNKLIQFSYGELSMDERSSVLDQLLDSDALCSEFKGIETIKNLLNQEMYSPNPTSVKIILEESQRSELEAH